MPTETTPGNVPLNDQLGPLPARKIRHVYNERKGYACDCWTEDAVREYAAAAVAAERERWEAALGAVMPADFKDWHQNSAMERPAVAAWVIRNLRDREAYLEGMLSDLEDEA